MSDSTTSLPHSNDAERSLIGAVLISPKLMEQASVLLDVGAFYSDRHGKIFGALERLADAGSPLDLVTLKDELERTGELDYCGGPAYLADVACCVPKSDHINGYAGIVLEKAHRRDVLRQSAAITEAAFNGTSKADLADQIEALTQSSDAASAANSLALSATAGTRLSKKITLPKEIVSRLLDEGNRGYTYGETGGTKSLLWLYILVCIAGGIKVAGLWTVQKAMKVAMLFLEDRPTPDGGWPPRIDWRLQSIILGFGFKDDDPRLKLIGENLLLWCGCAYREGLAAAREHQSKMTAIDSWNCACPDDETDIRGRNKIRVILDQTHEALNNEAFQFIDHVNKGPTDGKTKVSDANRQYGSTGKRQPSDLMLMLSEAEPHPEADEVCAVLKATKSRDGIDMPKAGRTFVWRGLPSGRKIPLDTPVPITLEYVKDNISGQDLGKCRTDEKLERWKRAETVIRAAGGTLEITELATSLEISPNTVRTWIGADLSPFKTVERGVIGLNR